MEHELDYHKLPKDVDFDVAPGVTGMKIVFVNLYFVREPDAPANSWVLIDAGLGGSAGRIKAAAEAQFGKNNPPACILLTHGHFDHVGALKTLAEEWDVPVYAHPLEMPYLTGLSKYPPPDPSVGGGGMARMSFLYPRGPIDLGKRVKLLPPDGSVPGLPGWRWIFTPGHSPGHVAFFREHDRVLIAGDAFVTTNQASVYSVMTQQKELCGPPPYFTPDWQAAQASVEYLTSLQPEVAATGHGIPMYGGELADQLISLADNFQFLAVPRKGRYVPYPAITDEEGIVELPPKPKQENMGLVAAVGALALAGLAYFTYQRWQKRSTEPASHFTNKASKKGRKKGSRQLLKRYNH